jgi:carbon-monoxide dehydrogenase medium subunit
MVPFDFLVPYSMDEAIGLLDPEDPDVCPVGGGTAIMLMMKAGVLRPKRLVSLQHVEAAYSQIRINTAGELVIGGLAKLSAIEQHPDVARAWPMLARTMRTLSSVRVRSVATLGGNLAHADPHMDLPPVLSALGARASIVGPRGRRSVGVDSLCVGYYETVLARDELIGEVIVPPQRGPAIYMKVTTRAAHDWPALGLAVVLDMQGDQIRTARIFVGAATDRPTRLHNAQAILEGAAIEPMVLQKAGDAGADEISIVGDAHGSAHYKRHLLRVNMGRAIRSAVAYAGSMK